MAVYTNPDPDQGLFPDDEVHFTYTGSYCTFNLQPGRYTIECYGASGDNDTYGGKGAL